MQKNDKKEFSSKYTLNYECFKEFSKGYQAVRKAPIVLLALLLLMAVYYLIVKRYEIVIFYSVFFIIFGLLIFVFKFKREGKLQYDCYKYLNDNKDVEVKVEIAKEKVKVISSKEKQEIYDFEKIVGIIETKNLLILKLDYNMGIIIAKNSLEGGTKEELLEYLYSFCPNIKRKKTSQAKMYLLVRKAIFVLYALVLLVAIILLILTSHRMDDYQNSLEEAGYLVEVHEDFYNGYDMDVLMITKGEERTKSYLYEFKKDNDAKRNIKYWLNEETEEDVKDEYVIKDTSNYQKYVILEDGKYIILIRKDNYVFYGIGTDEYQEELDAIVKIIDEEMN